MAAPRPSKVPAILIVLALMLSVGIGLLFAETVRSSRNAQWHAAKQNGTNLAASLEEALNSTLQGFDKSLEGLARALEDPKLMRLREPMRQRVLFDEALRMRGNGGVTVLDARGDAILDYASPIPQKVNLADQDYFRAFSHGGHDGLFIGAPVLSQVNGKYSLPFARAVHSSNGAFAGVVVGTVRIGFFYEMFSRLSLGEKSSIALVRTDGMLFSRFPPAPTLIGQRIESTPLRSALGATEAGLTEDASIVDGSARLYAHHRIGRFPLIVIVGQSTSEIEARWKHSALMMGGFAVALMLASITLAVLFLRELHKRHLVTVRLKGAEREMRNEQERMRMTFRAIGDGIVSTDAQGLVTYLNPVAERMTGWRLATAAGRAVDDVCRLLLASADVPGSMEVTEPTALELTPLRRALDMKTTVGPTRGVVLQHLDGTRFDVEETASAILDRRGRAIGAVMVLRDVTETVAAAQRMEHKAHYDALTDLPNRMLLEDRATLALAQAKRDGKCVAVVYLDLDGFKQVNDQLGHDAGDHLLVQVARRLQAATRATDTVSRKGGDEFVVLLTGISDASQLEIIANKLMGVCAQVFRIGLQQACVGMSAGIAIYPEHGETMDALSRKADAAMYAAKKAGKRQVHLHVEDAPSRCLVQADSPPV